MIVLAAFYNMSPNELSEISKIAEENKDGFVKKLTSQTITL